MFTQNFEKVADVGSALKAVGKSAVEAAKGIGSGAKDLGKKSIEKMKHEGPKLKQNWKGFKDPSSYRAAGEFAAKMSPEIAVAGALGLGAKKILDPNESKSATLAYY
jgi:hypothetical protein